MTGRDKFNKFKKIILLCSNFLSVFGHNFNLFFFKFSKNISGTKGILIRYIFARNIFKSIGDNVSIHEGVFIFNHSKISFGNNVSIHPMCYLEGAGQIEIGNEVSIAHSSSFISTNHSWDDISLPIKYNKENFENIIINDDVWIGCGVRVLSGVEIGSRSIVAAGAVVNKNVKRGSIVGGVPANQIKKIT